MPRKLSFSLFALCSTLLLSPAYALDRDNDREPPSIIVPGEGRVFVKPDLVTVEVGVVSTASTAAKALAANNAAVAELTKTVTAQGIADKDIQTSNFSISPEYAQNNNGGPAKIRGYSVRNSVHVKIHKVSQAGALLDAVVQSGANEVGAISFSVDEPSKLLDEARKLAVDDARRKATVYAGASGVKLVKVLNVIESGGYSPIRPMMASRMAMMGAADGAVPISAGEQELKVNATVVFQIE